MKRGEVKGDGRMGRPTAGRMPLGIRLLIGTGL